MPKVRDICVPDVREAIRYLYWETSLSAKDIKAAFQLTHTQQIAFIAGSHPVGYECAGCENEIVVASRARLEALRAEEKRQISSGKFPKIFCKNCREKGVHRA